MKICDSPQGAIREGHPMQVAVDHLQEALSEATRRVEAANSHGAIFDTLSGVASRSYFGDSIAAGEALPSCLLAFSGPTLKATTGQQGSC
eukprot:739967-Hanusia_phi.AAC.1